MARFRSQAERNRLPKSEFALPGKGTGPEGKGPGSYPIDTAGRARSALSRASANASPAEEAKIRAAVHHKYPGMEMSGEDRHKNGTTRRLHYPRGRG